MRSAVDFPLAVCDNEIVDLLHNFSATLRVGSKIVSCAPGRGGRSEGQKQPVGKEVSP